MTRSRANLLLLLTALIWGSTFVAQRVSMEGLGPMAYTAIRFALGALVVLPLVLRERGRGEWEKAGRPTLLLGIGAVGLALFAGAVLQQIGLVHTTATNAGFLTGIYVPLVPLIGLLLGQRPHPAVWVAAAACVGGFYLLSVKEGLTFNPGDLWVAASAFFWAGHVLLVAHFARRLPIFTLAAGQFLVCATVAALWSLATETTAPGAVSSLWLQILWGGALSVGVAFTLQVLAQGHTGPAEAAVILSMETVFAAVFGWLLLGERLDERGLYGCALIFAGMLACQLLPLWRRARPVAEAT